MARFLNPVSYFDWLRNVIGKVEGHLDLLLKSSAFNNLTSFPEALREIFPFPILVSQEPDLG